MANKVADEIVCEETDVLEKIIPQMFEVMHRVAKFSCDYVRHGRGSFCRLDTRQGLMIERQVGQPTGRRSKKWTRS